METGLIITADLFKAYWIVRIEFNLNDEFTWITDSRQVDKHACIYAKCNWWNTTRQMEFVYNEWNTISDSEKSKWLAFRRKSNLTIKSSPDSHTHMNVWQTNRNCITMSSDDQLDLVMAITGQFHKSNEDSTFSCVFFLLLFLRISSLFLNFVLLFLIIIHQTEFDSFSTNQLNYIRI